MRFILASVLAVFMAQQGAGQEVSLSTRNIQGTRWELYSGSGWPLFYLTFDSQGNILVARDLPNPGEYKYNFSGTYKVIDAKTLSISYSFDLYEQGGQPDENNSMITFTGTLKRPADSVQFEYAICDEHDTIRMVNEDIHVPANLLRSIGGIKVQTMGGVRAALSELSNIYDMPDYRNGAPQSSFRNECLQPSPFSRVSILAKSLNAASLPLDCSWYFIEMDVDEPGAAGWIRYGWIPSYGLLLTSFPVKPCK